MHFLGWFNQMKIYSIARRDGDVLLPSPFSSTTCIYVATDRVESGTLPDWKLIQKKNKVGEEYEETDFLLSSRLSQRYHKYINPLKERIVNFWRWNLIWTWKRMQLCSTVHLYKTVKQNCSNVISPNGWLVMVK